MRKLILAAVMAVSLSGAAGAADADGGWSVKGGGWSVTGIISCAKYLDKYSRSTFEGESGFNGPYAFLGYSGWIDGFVSGYNIAADTDITKGMTRNDVRRWIASWCRDNGSRDVFVALIELMRSRQ